MDTKDLLVAVMIGFLLAKVCSCKCDNKPKLPPPPQKPKCKCVYYGISN
ncbi:MAG: hypothetical protein J6Y44_03590 [Clostridia bacterium]|nr:hypothetical protein [Clostridia bacterium]